MTPPLNGPDPSVLHPLSFAKRVSFLKNAFVNPRIVIGEYTYYDDDEQEPAEFETRNILYLGPHHTDRLVIGKFCAIAKGVQFIMSGANHHMDGLSTFPFKVFGNGWEKALPEKWKERGDTVVGNDVWLGYEALVMPGIHIGDGAIVGSRALVAGDVPPYAIVGGNPARVIRQRFTDVIINRLLAVRWWDWPPEKITRNVHLISGGDVEALERCV